MTGYALAFPVHSKYKAIFNDKLLELRENGNKKKVFLIIKRYFSA